MRQTVDIFAEDLKAWIPWEDGAEIYMRFMDRAELDKLDKLSKKTKWKNNQQTEGTDSLKANRLLSEATILDWKGLVINGKELPYSKENASLMMVKDHDFSVFINKNCMENSAYIDRKDEGTKKK